MCQKIDDRKLYLASLPEIFERKDPGFVRFRSILDDPQNLNKKYCVSEKLWSFYNSEFFLQEKFRIWQREELLF